MIRIIQAQLSMGHKHNHQYDKLIKLKHWNVCKSRSAHVIEGIQEEQKYHYTHC